MQRPLLLKLFTLGLLSLLLLIPLLLIGDKLDERRSYRADAEQSIAHSWAGRQQVLGPVLVVPYVVRERVREWDQDGKHHFDKEVQRKRQQLILPDALQVDSRLATELRYLGIHQVPVYTAALTFSGHYPSEPLRALRARADVVSIGEPWLALHVTDPIGLSAVPVAEWNGGERPFDGAGSGIDGLETGLHAPLGEVDPDPLGGQLPFRLSVSLRGMAQIAVAPVGKSMTMNLQSVWPHPRFTGRVLPSTRSIGADGFSARWQTTSQIARLSGKCGQGVCRDYLDNALGVALVDPVDAYLQTERSLKYGLLFVGLTFVGFLLIELLRRLRIHPVQYLLVGLALTIFYLLLLSLAEHIAFGYAYGIATVACLSLLGYYLRHVLASTRLAALYTTLLALLYATLYVIIGAEDYALLMGSGLIFLSLALVMVLTRQLDWYRVGERLAPARMPTRDDGAG